MQTNRDGDAHINEQYKHIGTLPSKSCTQYSPYSDRSWTGYFTAGGIASVTSRTVTAPLDRLKIYLISNTTTQAPHNEALGSGIRKAVGAVPPTNTIRVACIALCEAGGMRSLVGRQVSMIFPSISFMSLLT